MLANPNPIYVLSPRRGTFRLSAANTAKDGTGTVNALFTALALASKGGGSLVERVSVVASATTTAGVIRLFISDSAGTNYRLYMEFPVPAWTASATVVGWTTGSLLAGTVATEASVKSPWINVNIRLEPGQILGVTTNNAEAFEAHAEGGDY